MLENIILDREYTSPAFRHLHWPHRDINNFGSYTRCKSSSWNSQEPFNLVLRYLLQCCLKLTIPSRQSLHILFPAHSDSRTRKLKVCLPFPIEFHQAVPCLWQRYFVPAWLTSVFGTDPISKMPQPLAPHPLFLHFDFNCVTSLRLLAAGVNHYIISSSDFDAPGLLTTSQRATCKVIAYLLPTSGLLSEMITFFIGMSQGDPGRFHSQGRALRKHVTFAVLNDEGHGYQAARLAWLSSTRIYMSRNERKKDWEMIEAAVEEARAVLNGDIEIIGLDVRVVTVIICSWIR